VKAAVLPAILVVMTLSACQQSNQASNQQSGQESAQQFGQQSGQLSGGQLGQESTQQSGQPIDQDVAPPQSPTVDVRLASIGEGWSSTAVNVTIHRKHSLGSFAGYQYVAFYDQDAQVVLGRRLLNEDDWELHTTQYSGNADDEHNTINLMVDGEGYLHIAWDHHVDPLRYAISTEPGSLMLGEEQAITGEHEDKVTYPEFYPIPGGDILMAYRHGSSGNGNMVLNRYDHQAKRWIRLQDALVSGEAQRNPYWQLHVQDEQTIHISWVWRETSDVLTNHDMMYARSNDGGQTWQRSSGESYQLPITQASAEVIWPIEQESNLINQTSMTADANGYPWIASYWRAEDDEATQVRVISFNGTDWSSRVLSNRITDFSLAGKDTRIVPLSRPLIVADNTTSESRFAVIYRDVEAGNRVLMTTLTPDSEPVSIELTSESTGAWEPTYDPLLWREQQVLHLLLQPVFPSEDATSSSAPTTASVLEVKPF